MYYKFYLLAVLSCLLVSSCSEESYRQDFSTPDTNRISFSCTAEEDDGTLSIWDAKSQIGMFCDRTATSNRMLTIAAASAGTETALFYTDIEWEGADVHRFSLYTPYDESNATSVVRGTLPASYTQTGSSSEALDRFNLTYAVVETLPTEMNTPVEVEMKKLLVPVDIRVQSEAYASGWTLEQISIEASDDRILAGNYTFDLDSEAYEFTDQTSGRVTINLPSLPIGKNGTHAYMLAKAEEDLSIPCTFEVTIASEGDGNLLLRGTHPLTAATVLSVDGFESTIVGDNAIDLSTSGPGGVRETANCYVASRAGATYRFPATVMGNGYATPADPAYNPSTPGTAPGITPTALDPKSAQILWQTAPDLIGNIKLRNGYVYFTLGGEEGGSLTSGNAVIAVYSGADATGDILWSWHIWVTDADLDGCLQTWKVHSDLTSYPNYQNPMLMDRNLGALTVADFAASGTNESHGLHYQWGRKDPFVGADNASATSRVAVATYDSRNSELGAMTKAEAFSAAAAWTHVDRKIARADIAKYPMAFVSGKTNYFWMEESAHDLWGLPAYADESNDLGHKTIYDPCPPGYRVMSPYAMTGVTSAMAGGALKNLSHSVLNVATYRADQAALQVYCNEDQEVAKLPAAGLVYFEMAENYFPFDRIGTYGYYWTTKMTGTQENRAYRMHFDWNNFVSMEGAYASYGHNVRCEKIK